jgi:pimeloyl-ACP methyl ester carboxylesterase
MPIASINGIDLYYEVEGEGAWIAFAHGGEGLHLCWWKQVAAFRQRFRCLTYDARGFGLSGGGWGGLPEDSAASDLLGLLDHLDIDRAFLVGHSMGGMAVSGVAQRSPGRVRALVMGDTPFGFQTAALSRWADEMLQKIPSGFNVFEHLFAPGFAEAQPELHCLYTGLCRLNSVRPLPKNTGDYLEAYVRMRDAPPVDYSGFSVPSLFIVGDQDELTLPWLMEATAKAVGGSRFLVVPGAGHSAFLERSEVYNKAVLDFFEEVRGGRV